MRPNRKEILLLSLILLGGVAIRMIHVTQPYVDHWCYRQTDTAQIARNFSLYGFNIFSPQINWGGNVPGYIGTEFPLVPFLASLLYLFFGVQDWIGRSISIFFFATSIPALWALVRKYSDSNVALYSITIYSLIPIAIFTGRSFMPDMAMLSLMLWSLYSFERWIEHPEEKSKAMIAMLLTSLAILVKAPAVLLGFPFLFIAYRRYGWGLLSQKKLWLFAVAVLLPPALWYSHAKFVAESNLPHHSFGQGIIQFAPVRDYVRVLWRLTTKSLTVIVVALMIIGLFLSLRKKQGLIFHLWLLAIFAFSFVAAKGHLKHEWYLLTVAPIAAFLCAVTLCDVLAKVHSTFLKCLVGIGFLFCLAVASFFAVREKYESWNMAARNLGLELERISNPSELVAVIDEADSTTIYYSNRKGWHFPPYYGARTKRSAKLIGRLEKIRPQGAAFLGISKDHFWWLDFYKEFHEHLETRYERIRDTPEYIIFDLRMKPKADHQISPDE
jgi:4-amino-4-deoxy-L-arabinose transferase-like glycosyltransferase